MPLPFSADFGKTVKIAVLYIKHKAYSFLAWLGDFRDENNGFLLVFSSLAQQLCSVVIPLVVRVPIAVYNYSTWNMVLDVKIIIVFFTL